MLKVAWIALNKDNWWLFLKEIGQNCDLVHLKRKKAWLNTPLPISSLKIESFQCWLVRALFLWKRRQILQNSVDEYTINSTQTLQSSSLWYFRMILFDISLENNIKASQITMKFWLPKDLWQTFRCRRGGAWTLISSLITRWLDLWTLSNRSSLWLQPSGLHFSSLTPPPSRCPRKRDVPSFIKELFVSRDFFKGVSAAVIGISDSYIQFCCLFFPEGSSFQWEFRIPRWFDWYVRPFREGFPWIWVQKWQFPGPKGQLFDRNVRWWLLGPCIIRLRWR